MRGFQWPEWAYRFAVSWVVLLREMESLWVGWRDR